jgi:hypothetical protein
MFKTLGEGEEAREAARGKGGRGGGKRVGSVGVGAGVGIVYGPLYSSANTWCASYTKKNATG